MGINTKTYKITGNFLYVTREPTVRPLFLIHILESNLQYGYISDGVVTQIHNHQLSPDQMIGYATDLKYFLRMLEAEWN
jgi:hypothetical protein